MQNEQDFVNEPAGPAAQMQEEKPLAKPWGFWATFGFCCIIGVVYLIVSFLVAFSFIIPAVIANPKLDMKEYGQTLSSSGFYISASITAGALVIIFWVVLFSGIKKRITIKEYLSLKNPGAGQFVKWSFVLILFVVCSDALTFFLGRPVVPDFMIKAYTSAGFLPLLWFAVILAAPISEELLFRAFLFKGIEYSRLGSVGAIVITSFVWSIIHLQYDLYGIASIFVGGLLVGLARFKTKSVYVPIAMHSLMNLAATVECAVVLSGK